jgi:hypothetical protein
VNRADVADGLAVLAKASWSSNVTEKGHRAASLISQMHRRCVPKTMQDRSLLISAKPLFDGIRVTDKIANLGNRLARLETRRPSHIQGRQMYLKDLFQLAKAQMCSGRIYKNPWKDYNRRIFVKHSTYWHRLQESKRKIFEDRAAKARCAAYAKIIQDRQGLAEQLADERKKLWNDATIDRPIQLQDAKLSKSDMMQFDEVYKSTLGRQWSDLVPEHCWEIRETPLVIQKIIDKVPFQSPDAISPGWASLIANSRDILKTAIIKIWPPHPPLDCHRFYRFAFAFQSPHMVAMIKLDLVTGHPSMIQNTDIMSGEEKDALRKARVRFKIVPGGFAFSDDDGFNRGETIEMILDSTILSGGIIGAVDPFIGIDDLRHILPGKMRADAEKKEKAKKDLPIKCDYEELHALLEEYPWMMPMIDPEDFATEKKKRKRSMDEQDSQGMDPVDSIFDQLHQKRMAMAMDQQNAQQHFSINIRGGRWTMQHNGMSYDSYRAKADGSDAENFCTDLGWPKTFTAAVKTYGDHNAHALCRCWQHRMMHLFRHFVENGTVIGASTDYTEPDDARTITAESAMQRLNQIRRLGD